MNEFGLALRPELYGNNEIFDFVRLADSSGDISHVLFPDIPYGNDPIELSTASLAVSKRIQVGSGVLRLTEHDPNILARRLQTIQFLSGNRFVLGIGTGAPGPNPAQTIDQMFSLLATIKRSFSSNGVVKFPSVFVAALKPRMATKSIEHADGLLLNFCSPRYAKRLTDELDLKNTSKSIACYIKVFFSRRKEDADKLLIEEFAKYDKFPQYHKMFENDHVSDSITSAKLGLSTGRVQVPDMLKRICLSNPSTSELSSLVVEFRRSGINLPCVYPYFSVGESYEFKKQTMNLILGASSI